MADITEIDLLEALQARLQRVLVADGYYTDAGEKVVVQRADPSPESDGPLLISVYLVTTKYETEGPADQYVTAETEFEIGAFTAADVEGQIESTKLLRDVLKGTFSAPAAPDALSRNAQRMYPTQSDIYLAPPGYDYTVVALKLIVRWCDHTLE